MGSDRKKSWWRLGAVESVLKRNGMELAMDDVSTDSTAGASGCAHTGGVFTVCGRSLIVNIIVRGGCGWVHGGRVWWWRFGCGRY